MYLVTHAHRARVRQLEAEDAEHASRLAAVESRAVSEMRAEQESCLKKISDAEARHQVSSGLTAVIQLSVQAVHPAFTILCESCMCRVDVDSSAATIKNSATQQHNRITVQHNAVTGKCTRVYNFSIFQFSLRSVVCLLSAVCSSHSKLKYFAVVSSNDLSFRRCEFVSTTAGRPPQG